MGIGLGAIAASYFREPRECLVPACFSVGFYLIATHYTGSMHDLIERIDMRFDTARRMAGSARAAESFEDLDLDLDRLPTLVEVCRQAGFVHDGIQLLAQQITTEADLLKFLGYESVPVSQSEAVAFLLSELGDLKISSTRPTGVPPEGGGCFYVQGPVLWPGDDEKRVDIVAHELRHALHHRAQVRLLLRPENRRQLERAAKLFDDNPFFPNPYSLRCIAGITKYLGAVRSIHDAVPLSVAKQAAHLMVMYGTVYHPERFEALAARHATNRNGNIVPSWYQKLGVFLILPIAKGAQFSTTNEIFIALRSYRNERLLRKIFRMGLFDAELS